MTKSLEKKIFHIFLAVALVIQLVSLIALFTIRTSFTVSTIIYVIKSVIYIATIVSILINRYTVYKKFWWLYILLLPFVVYYLVMIPSTVLSKSLLSFFYISFLYLYSYYVFQINYHPLINFLYLVAPFNWKIIHKKAGAYCSRGENKKCLSLIEELKKKNVSLEYYGMIEGISYFYLKKYSKCKDIILSWFEEYNHQDYFSLKILGTSFFELSEFNEAIKYLSMSLELKPDENECVFYIASSYAGLENNEKAISYYKKYLSVEPNSPYALYNIGRNYYLIDDMNKAKRYWELSIAQQQPSATGYIALAVEYHESGDTEKAIQYFNYGIGIEPELIDYVPEDLLPKIKR